MFVKYRSCELILLGSLHAPTNSSLSNSPTNNIVGAAICRPRATNSRPYIFYRNCSPNSSLCNGLYHNFAEQSRCSPVYHQNAVLYVIRNAVRGISSLRKRYNLRLMICTFGCTYKKQRAPRMRYPLFWRG